MWKDDAELLLKDFIESLKDKRKINILGKDHLKSLYIVEACINSAKRGKKIDLKNDFI